MNQIYRRVAVFLNNFENHATETMHEDALIAKSFVFQFVNSYISLFYIAYIKGRDIKVFGFEAGSCRGTCFQELAMQLFTLVVFNQITGQIQEFVMPQLKTFIKYVRSKVKRTQKENVQLPPYLVELNLPEYEGTFTEYNEMAIQFGYVVMFAAAFPVASVAALINNWIEIRVDASKVLLLSRRPHYQGCEDIGTWQKVFEILGILSVINNCCLLGFTSTFMSGKCVFLRDMGCSATEPRECDHYEGDSVRTAVTGELFYLGDHPPFQVNCTTDLGGLHGIVNVCCPTHPKFLPANAIEPVTTNHALFLDPFQILWVVLITEHVLLLVRFVISELIPDRPAWIDKAKKAQMIEQELLFSVISDE
eukprot:c19059_g1_i1.p1 GENE.c19059_g1_i1~~c19059_g1_i1.p1  ORF type:complete len:364 (+),score=110.63 c19059_g1_i1:464-1555(+)